MPVNLSNPASLLDGHSNAGISVQAGQLTSNSASLLGPPRGRHYIEVNLSNAWVSKGLYLCKQASNLSNSTSLLDGHSNAGAVSVQAGSLTQPACWIPKG